MQTIILCGGMGARLREETEYKPKPMVEIGGKPILWHIMKHYARYGHKEFILALGYKGDVIRDFFLNFYKYNSDFTVDLANNGNVEIHNSSVREDWTITLVETGSKSMTGYRVKQCSRYITGDRFMVTYGDAVSNVDLDKLIDFHIQQNTVGTVTGVYPPSRFGDLQVDEKLVIRFKEKIKDPELQAPINGGYFVFNKEIIDYIDNDITCDLEKAPMNRLVEEKQLSIYKHTDFWQCMDTYRDYQLLEQLWQESPPWKIW